MLIAYKHNYIVHNIGCLDCRKKMNKNKKKEKENSK